MSNGKPAHRSVLIHDEDYSTVSRYQSEFRGVVQYYLLAQNVSHFGKLQWVMGQSLTKTLASRHKTTTRKVFRRYRSTALTEHGERACLKVEVQRGNGKRPLVAQFGGIPLKRNRQAVLADQKPQRYRVERNELIKRLLADECELCGSTVNVEVHHIRALRDLNVKGQRGKPKWVQVMAARKRKTLVVCRTCHLNAHDGSWKTAQATVSSIRAVMPQHLPLNDWPVVKWAAIDLYTERATEAPKRAHQTRARDSDPCRTPPHLRSGLQ